MQFYGPADQSLVLSLDQSYTLNETCDILYKSGCKWNVQHVYHNVLYGMKVHVCIYLSQQCCG